MSLAPRQSRSIGATVRLLVEDILAIAAAVAALGWFLKSSLVGQPAFEPVLAFLGALTVLMGKEPLRERLAVAGQAHLHDRALFEAFLRILPTEPTIRLLKEQDFGDSFPKRAIDPLYEFAATWGSVENEFLNARLEKEKRTLVSVAGDLAAEIAASNSPTGNLHLAPPIGGFRPAACVRSAAPALGSGRRTGSERQSRRVCRHVRGVRAPVPCETCSISPRPCRALPANQSGLCNCAAWGGGCQTALPGYG